MNTHESYQRAEEGESLLTSAPVVLEEPSRFGSTTFKISLAGLAAIGLLALGVFAFPEESASMTGFTSLSFFHSSEYGKSTRRNTNSKEIKYLDRHSLSCGNDFLNRFKVTSSLGYSYDCLRGSGVSGSVVTRYTSYKRGGTDGINFLDRQNIACSGDELIAGYKMQTRGWRDRDFRYMIRCIKPHVKSLSCSNRNTAWNTYDSLVYLDRHDITCPDNQGLQQFKVDTGSFRERDGRERYCRRRRWWCRSWGWRDKYKNVAKIQYNYKCCAMDTYDPTPAPIANPTQSPTPVPIANPTAVPIANPTAEPSHAPISEPTDAPVAVPTMEPTINRKPLACKMTGLSGPAEQYTSKMNNGCALLALDDLGFEGHVPSTGLLVCGSFDADGTKFASMGLQSGGKSKDVSYMYVTEQMKIQYFTELNFAGQSDSFNFGDEPIVHHKIVGADANDAIKSMHFISDYEGEIPAECPGGGEKLSM